MELASLQTAFLTLDIAIKQTNRRVNALDNVVRPRLENTIAYIKVRTWVVCACLPICSTLRAELKPHQQGCAVQRSIRQVSREQPPCKLQLLLQQTQPAPSEEHPCAW